MIVYHCMSSYIMVSRSFVAMKLALWMMMELMVMMVAVLPFLLEELLLQ